LILNNAVNTGPFIYCMAYFGPHETNQYFNGGNGHYHQCLYIVQGQGRGTITDKDNNVVSQRDDDSQGKLIDLQAFKDMTHTTETQDQPLSLISFNPIPDTRLLDVEIIKGPQTKTVTADKERVTVVCITGPITANGKSLASLQHAKVFPEKSAELNLPKNSIVALVSNKCYN
jgi:hypothetical protein